MNVLVRAYGFDPQIKVEAGSTEIQSDCINTTVVRPENAISYVKLVASDYEGKNYVGNLDAFTVLKVSFRYGSDAWTKVFEGTVYEVGPELDKNQQTVVATAYGYGRALAVTHCNVNYGKESENTTIDTPEEIWDDLVDNHINKDFDGNATGYAITKTKIKAIATPTINFVPSPYRKNIDLINQVCRFYTASQAGAASVHWFVDPSKNLWIDSIGAHTVDTANWPSYWGASQAASTLVEGEDFVHFDFKKKVKGFANKIILLSPLRKPGYDYWCEDSGGQALWGSTDATLTDDAAIFIVGSHSLKIAPSHAVNPALAYFPSAQNAAWDLSVIGSEQNVPSLNFYVYGDIKSALSKQIELYTSAGNYYVNIRIDEMLDVADEWHHISLPIGPYHKTAEESRRLLWTAVGAPDWTNINWVLFRIVSIAQTNITYVDDLHFSGKIIREAYNSTSIAADDEHQKVIRLDMAVDDSMKAADDSGTAGRLAYAELLTAQKKPVVGTVTIPLIVDALPGELFHIHADEQANGSFRVDSDFRAKKITHQFTSAGAFTMLDLTDDVTNTFAKGQSDLLSELGKATFVDPDAKNLFASGVDLLIGRLSLDYP